MGMRVRRNGSVAVLEMEGDVDAYSIVKVKDILSELMDEDRYRVIMDLGRVERLNYAGIGILVERLGKMRSRKGDLKLIGVSKDMQDVFRRMGVGELFGFYDDEESALRSFGDEALGS